jgi:hypothetical protein
VDWRFVSRRCLEPAIEVHARARESVAPLARTGGARRHGFPGRRVDLAILNAGAALDPRSDGERALRLQGVCLLAATNCPGEFHGDTTGAKAADCVAFMQTKPYGSWNRANSDTVTCREAHSILTSLRPEVHCPHVGKTAGMVCVDVSYASYFDTRY